MKKLSFLVKLPLPVIILLSLIVGGTYVYASLDKIANPGAFAQNVYNYRFLPVVFLHFFAVYLPWVEILAGIALFIPWVRRGGALLCGLMTLMFIVGISWALYRNLDISCGCFETGAGHAVGLDLLIRDILLFVACLLLFIQKPGEVIPPDGDLPTRN
ncbi:MAG: DoxX family protein [bacterium]|nr:DoxX family protein [bacterium]